MATAIFHQEGRVIDYTPSSAVTAGDVVNFGGNLVGIPANDIAANVLGAVAIEGVFKVPNNSTPITYAVGDTVKWDTVALTTTSAALSGTVIAMGKAVVAGAGTTVYVKINA